VYCLTQESKDIFLEDEFFFISASCSSQDTLSTLVRPFIDTFIGGRSYLCTKDLLEKPRPKKLRTNSPVFDDNEVWLLYVWVEDESLYRCVLIVRIEEIRNTAGDIHKI